MDKLLNSNYTLIEIDKLLFSAHLLFLSKFIVEMFRPCILPSLSFFHCKFILQIRIKYNKFPKYVNKFYHLDKTKHTGEAMPLQLLLGNEFRALHVLVNVLPQIYIPALFYLEIKSCSLSKLALNLQSCCLNLSNSWTYSCTTMPS